MGGATERSGVPSCGSVEPVTARREAMPLPLFAIAGVEREVMEEGACNESADTLLMVCLLLMFWGALRFSDLQRVEVWSMELQGDVVRGYCWKTKPRREACRGVACAMASTGLGRQLWVVRCSGLSP